MRTLPALLLVLAALAPAAAAAGLAAPTPAATWSAHNGDGEGRAEANLTLAGAGPADTDLGIEARYALEERIDPSSALTGNLTWRTLGGTLRLFLGIPREVACMLACDEGAAATRDARLDADGRVALEEGPRARSAPAGATPGHAAAAVAGGASALALLAWLASRGGGLLALYSRLRKGRVMEDPRRQAILALLAEAPALTAADVSRRLALPRTSVLHHLQILRAHELVSSRREGRRTLYLPRGQRVPEEEVEARAVLDVPARAAVLAALREAAQARTQRELAEATGLPRRTVAHHLARLAQRGLVAVAPDARPARYEAARRLDAEARP